MSDRFDEIIRKYYGDYQGYPAVINALCDAARRIIGNRDEEIERLRRIEDAVIEWTALSADKASQYQTARNLVNVLNANPRPEE